MKMKIITYWITTALVALVMAISGVMAITHAPPMMKALAHLGYVVLNAKVFLLSSRTNFRTRFSLARIALHPPISCIDLNVIPLKRRNLFTIDGVRFKRFAMTAFSSCFFAASARSLAACVNGASWHARQNDKASIACS